jgi:hypothetical protein
MYKVFLTNQPAGFPLEIDGFFKFQQDGYNQPLEALAKAFGNMAIVDGMVEGVVGGDTVVSDGFAIVNNELVFFRGAIKQTTFDVNDETANLIFKGGTAKPVLKTRVAIFNTGGTGVYNYADLKRVQTSPGYGLVQRVEQLERMMKPLLSYQVDGDTVYGSWLFWGRPASEIPEGWEAVPDADLKGTVLVGLDADQEEFAAVGQVGGEKTHVLTHGEMPDLDVVIPQVGYGGIGGTGTKLVGTANTPDAGELTIHVNTGGGSGHNNLQPYKVVMYIRFVG